MKEKGSKFIGYGFPVRTETDIKQSLELVKAAHPKATHHCYGFRLGADGDKFRANDDGEPGGSAGLPIYNQILSFELTNILIVVVRYYGGTKLGVAGLIKAYKETARATLGSAEIVVKELMLRLKITFPFEKQNTVYSVLNKANAKILEFKALQFCEMTAEVKASQQKEISEQLSEIQYVLYHFKD